MALHDSNVIDLEGVRQILAKLRPAECCKAKPMHESGGRVTILCEEDCPWQALDLALCNVIVDDSVRRIQQRPTDQTQAKTQASEKPALTSAAQPAANACSCLFYEHESGLMCRCGHPRSLHHATGCACSSGHTEASYREKMASFNRDLTRALSEPKK